MKRTTIAIGFCLSIAFLILASLYRDFVLDDAFIIYRYSRHLAHGHGLVWNIGERPVEGCTSFLWVVINAAAFPLKMDPVALSKVLSVLFSLALIWIIAAAGGRGRPALVIVTAGAVALNPSFAFVGTMGMETALAVLLMTAMGWAAIRASREGGRRIFFLLHALAFLSLLTRPDAAPFAAGVYAGLAGVLAFTRKGSAIKGLVVAGIPFLALGAAYMAWRMSYFETVFPNSYYIKVNSDDPSVAGLTTTYLKTFAKYMLLPYLFAAALVLWENRKLEQILHVVPVLLGCLAFGGYLLFVTPIQGIMWRYIYPGFMPFVLVLAAHSRQSGTVRDFWGGWKGAVLAAAFAAWTLHQLPLVGYARDTRLDTDRILAGKALKGIPGSMLVSESGALPYFSEWRSMDMLGLTSTEVAREGLSIPVIKAFGPDLVMTVVSGGRYLVVRDKGEILTRYLAENDFVAVAAIHKAESNYHFYFVRRDYAHFDEAVRRLRSIEGVRYGRLKVMMEDERVPVLGEKPGR